MKLLLKLFFIVLFPVSVFGQSPIINGVSEAEPGSTHTYTIDNLAAGTSVSWWFGGDATVVGTGTTITVTYGTYFSGGVLNAGFSNPTNWQWTTLTYSVVKIDPTPDPSIPVPALSGPSEAEAGSSQLYILNNAPATDIQWWGTGDMTVTEQTDDSQADVVFGVGFSGGNVVAAYTDPVSGQYTTLNYAVVKIDPVQPPNATTPVLTGASEAQSASIHLYTLLDAPDTDIQWWGSGDMTVVERADDSQADVSFGTSFSGGNVTASFTDPVTGQYTSLNFSVSEIPGSVINWNPLYTIRTTINGSDLAAISSTDANTSGVLSSDYLENGEGGYVEFEVSGNSGFVGLSEQENYVNSRYNKNIDYSIYVTNGSAYVNNEGVSVPVSAGDILRVERIASTSEIVFKHNGITIHTTSGIDPTKILNADVKFTHASQEVLNIKKSVTFVNHIVNVEGDESGPGELVNWNPLHFVRVSEEGNGDALVVGADALSNLNGALSSDFLPANTDGWVSFKIDESLGNPFAIGLSERSANAENTTYHSIDFMVQRDTRTLISRNLGAEGLKCFYQDGDEIKIERFGNEILLKRNGYVFERYTTDPTKEMLIDVALYNSSARVGGIRRSASFTTLEINLVASESHLFFDNNDKIIVPHNPALNLGSSDFTFEAWINLDESEVLGNNSPIISNRIGTETDGFIFGVNHDDDPGRLYMRMGSANYKVTVSNYINLADGQNHHVAITRTATHVRYFVDGQLLQERNIATSGIPINTIGEIAIGYTEYFAESFKGGVWDVRVWDKALTEADINSQKDIQLAGTETNLVAYWPLDEGSGQVVHDQSSNSNHGVLGTTNAQEGIDPIWGGRPDWENYTGDPIEGNLSFDDNDYITVSQSPDFDLESSDFTFEAWINLDESEATGSYSPIISNRVGTVDEGFIFGINHAWESAPSRPYVRMGNANYNVIGDHGISLADGKCHHVAVSRTGDKVKHFIDGVMIYERYSVNASAPINTTGDITLGYSEYFNHSFKGGIWDVRVWNRVLSEDEIFYRKDTKLTGSEAGLVAYWPLDEGNGQVALDHSSNSNDGVLGATNNEEATDPTWGGVFCGGEVVEWSPVSIANLDVNFDQSISIGSDARYGNSGGAYSIQQLAESTNGSFEVELTELADKAIGLDVFNQDITSGENSDYSIHSTDYYLRVENEYLLIYINQVQNPTGIHLEVGDELGISRIGTTLNFIHNGSVVQSITVDEAERYVVDMMLIDATSVWTPITVFGFENFELESVAPAERDLIVNEGSLLEMAYDENTNRIERVANDVYDDTPWSYVMGGEYLAPGDTGYFEITHTEASSENSLFMLGFANGDHNRRIEHRNTTASPTYVYGQQGKLRMASNTPFDYRNVLGRWHAGDRFGIGRRGDGTIYYTKNGVVFYEYQTNLLNYKLYPSVRIHYEDRTMGDMKVSGQFTPDIFEQGDPVLFGNEMVWDPRTSFGLRALDGCSHSERGLVARYFLNGDANDSYDNALNGTIHGNPVFTEDRFGNANSALLLDGVGDYVDASSSSFHLSTAYTYSLWIKPEDQARTYVALAVGGSGGDQAVSYSINGIGAGSYTKYQQDILSVRAEGNYHEGWHHVVVTRDGSSHRIYVDGVLKSENTPNFPEIIYGSNDFFFIGKSHRPTPDNFKGAIDDVLIYDQVMSPTEIQTLYAMDCVNGASQLTGNLVTGQGDVRAHIRSLSKLPANADGWVEIRTTKDEAFQGGIALSVETPVDVLPSDPTNIRGARDQIFFTESLNYVRPAGLLKLRITNYEGDVYRIERSGNKLLWKRNGYTLIERDVNPAEELFVYGVPFEDKMLPTAITVSSSFVTELLENGAADSDDGDVLSFDFNSQIGLAYSSGNLISNTSPSGISGEEVIEAERDGWIQSNSIPSGSFAISLAQQNSTTELSDMDYRIVFDGVYASLYSKNNQLSSWVYTSTDVFRIERAGTSIKFFKNQLVLEEVSIDNSEELIPDTRFEQPNLNIANPFTFRLLPMSQGRPAAYTGEYYLLQEKLSADYAVSSSNYAIHFYYRDKHLPDSFGVNVYNTRRERMEIGMKSMPTNASNQYQVPIQTLSPGFYFLEVKATSGEILKLRFKI